MAQTAQGLRTADSRIVRHALVWPATGLFVAFLALAFLYMSWPCDLELYHFYARTARSQSVATLYHDRDVEYPPLAIELLLMTEEASARLPATPFLARFNVYKGAPSEFQRFKLVYRLTMAVCSLVTWAMVVVLLRRHFREETAWEWAERLLALGVSLWPLGYVLLDRLDIALTCLTVVALVLLLSRARSAWSFAVLAAAIAFKLVPVALLPIWLLASIPGSLLSGLGGGRGRRQFLAACLPRTGALGVSLVACTVAIWLPVGKACLGFLAFHAQRGIEFQSNYAAVLTLFKHLGYPVRTKAGWGSAVLDCTAAPWLARLSPLLVGLFLAAGIGLLLVTVVRRSARTTSPIAHADPALVLGHVLWALLVFVLFNKTFSPQYALWLAPLVAVVPLRGLRRRCFQLGFFGVAYLTMLISPRCLVEVIGVPIAPNVLEATGASVLGTSLLLARLLLLLVLTAMLGHELFRRARQCGGVPSGQCSDACMATPPAVSNSSSHS